jgi:hypothetical protein
VKWKQIQGKGSEGWIIHGSWLIGGIRRNESYIKWLSNVEQVDREIKGCGGIRG